MSTPYSDYPSEKVPEIEVYELPQPVPAPRPKRRSLGARVLKVAFLVFSALFVLHGLGFAFNALSGRGCHGLRKHMPHDFNPFDDGQKPFPPIDKWVPFNGTTHFEFDPHTASGFSVRGSDTFGKVVFETSKLSDKVVIDLDIKTNKHDKHGAVTVAEDNGYLTVDTPSTGNLKTYSSAKILIPSNIIGHFAIPDFQVDVPKHMVDYSNLPETLEIDTFKVRAAKGFVKPGPVHTNNTQITIAKGLLKGALNAARYNTDIDVAKGNVTLDIPNISSGNQGETKIHVGQGHLSGKLAVYNATALSVGSGSIYVEVELKDATPRADFSTKIASGSTRVYVSDIAAERTFEAAHSSAKGDMLITYPSNFQGTIDARGVLGDITLEGKDLAVEKVVGGLVGRKGDSERNSISVKTVSGKQDILIGDE